MKKWRANCFKGRRGIVRACVLIIMVAGTVNAMAQDGNQGIQDANDMVRGYFDDGTALMYAIGAVVGLIGAVKVYNKWSSGDPDTGRIAAAWFGACIFLVIVATVLRSFFGL